MGFFDTEKGVNEYIKMAEGYDGRALIKIFKNYLRKDSKVLELGMGPGKDLDILGENFVVTGSDNSSVFLEKYREKNPKADLMLLDAVTLNTDRKFDGIYSNKVLHHLTTEDLKTSLKNQKKFYILKEYCFIHFGKETRLKKWKDYFLCIMKWKL